MDELTKGLANVAITTIFSTSESRETPGAELPEPPDPTATPEAPVPPEPVAVPMPLHPEPADVPVPTVHQSWHSPPAHAPPRTRLDARATISAGGFGVVRLVCDPVSRLRYALKEIRKAHILQQNPEVRCAWISREREALEELNHHPFIVTLIGTYESTGHVYFLLELLRGGELLTIMQRIGCACASEDPHGPNHQLITFKSRSP